MDLVTNCGNLTPTTYDIIKFNGDANIHHGHIPYFHSMICQWAYSIAQPFSFVVVIDAQNKDYLLGQIKNLFPSLEPPGWRVNSVADATWTKQTQETIGCIFAEGTRIPGESINVERVGITEGSRRGFINAPIINGRADFEPLQIGFMETNQSFVDGVLRPWMVVGAHLGLLAMDDHKKNQKPKKSIKANISIYQLARAMNENKNIIRENVIRKHWIFRDCVPINVASEDITYGDSGVYPKKRVEFVYNSYSMEDTQSIKD